MFCYNTTSHRPTLALPKKQPPILKGVMSLGGKLKLNRIQNSKSVYKAICCFIFFCGTSWFWGEIPRSH